mgnify:FL=1
MKFKGHKSICSLKENIILLIDKGDTDKALRLIHDFVEYILTEPLYVSQVFGSKTLDALCQRIGQINLEKIKPEIDEINHPQLDKQAYVYIVTKLQNSGGHTRVIEDFIKSRPQDRHFILSTGLAGKSDSDYLLEKLDKKIDTTFEQAPKGNFQKRLTWLQKRLLKIQPKRVYLFNHHQDSVAVSAIQPEMNINTSFYHHGDHHLCLGVYLRNIEHIDPHPMGYHNCRGLLGIKNTYIPLTIDDQGKRPADRQFLQNGKLTTCTAARSNKIEQPYFISYVKVVPKILKATGGKHVHIGKLSLWARLKLCRELKNNAIPNERFIYIPWVPSVWEALHKYQVDLYIASFPYGGGLTLIEAMGAGVPVAVHKHIFSRILSGIDLAYPKAFSWKHPNELFSYCASLTSEHLEQLGQLARIQYEKYHTNSNLYEMLNNKNHGTTIHKDTESTFSVERDEWAMWVESQLNIKTMLSKIVYRILRKIRSRL